MRVDRDKEGTGMDMGLLGGRPERKVNRKDRRGSRNGV